MTDSKAAIICTVIIDASKKDIDEAERCGKPAVKRLPGELDFPVCAEHAEMFTPEYGRSASRSGDGR